MAKSYGQTKFTLKLVFNEERKKVVFAEACRDFVDVLFSLMTLPMGTIVRLLENHRKSETVPIGCFSNLYKSVVDMGTDDFETEACKPMLLYPRSLRDVECKRLKLNLHPTEGIKLFDYITCSSCKTCSYFSTSRCGCGKLMNEEISVTDNSVDSNVQDGVFVRGSKSSFIITDDLKVAVRSTDLVLRNLKSVGCGDFSKVAERLVDVGFDELCYYLVHVSKSFKELNATKVSASKALLPHYYTCQKQLLNIIIEQPCTFHRISDEEPLVLIDSKSQSGDQATKGSGFVKRHTKFTVSDGLIIRPMNSSSALYILKKLESSRRYTCARNEHQQNTGSKFVEGILDDIFCTE